MGLTEKTDGSEAMFRSADPGNELVQEEPGRSAGEFDRPATRGCTELHRDWSTRITGTGG